MAEAPKVEEEKPEYKTINVRGIPGGVDVPANFTDEQIAEAIRRHPGYKPAGDKIDKGTIRQSAENIAGFTNEVGKGIPIAGHYIPRSSFAENLGRNHPNWALGARMTGGVASMAPLMAATGGMSGPGMMAADAAIAGGTGMLDEVARQHHNLPKDAEWNNADMLKAGVLSAAVSPLGNVFNRMVSPTTLRGIQPGDVSSAVNQAAARMNQSNTRAMGGEDLVHAAGQAINSIPRTNPPSHWATDMMTNAGTTALGGAGLAHYMGFPPEVGATIGGFAGISREAVRDALLRSPWGRNTLLSGHKKEAIAKALAASAPSSMPPHGLDKLEPLQ